MEVIDVLKVLKKNNSELTLHNGIGYCAYGSVLLYNELVKLKIPCKLVKVSHARDDTKISMVIRSNVKTTILSLPAEGIYFGIKNNFIKRGDHLPASAGHAVVLVGDQIYDITSEQFGLPNVYSYKTLTDCWSKISTAEITLNNNRDDFFVGSVKLLENLIKKQA